MLGHYAPEGRAATPRTTVPRPPRRSALTKSFVSLYRTSDHPETPSAVCRFLTHQHLHLHGHSRLEIPPSSMTFRRLQFIRSNSAVLQRVRTSATTLCSLWIDIFDRIDWYDTEVFKEVLPQYFLGPRCLVFLGSSSEEPLNCVSTAALLPHAIDNFGDLQSTYLSLDYKVRPHTIYSYLLCYVETK